MIQTTVTHQAKLCGCQRYHAMMGKNFWMNRFNTETLRLWRQVIFRKIYQWDCLTFMILSWLWMIRCVLCLVASEGKCLHYIYIYIVKGNTLHVGGLFELSCPDRTTCTHCTLIQRAALRLPEMACLLTASLANRKMMCSDVAPLPSLEMIYMQAYRA